MRNFFALIGFFVVLLGGLGWYLDWYKISRRGSDGAQSSFQVDINRERIVKDVEHGLERGRDGLSRMREGESTPTATEKSTPSSTP